MQSLNIVFCWASVLHLIFNRFFCFRYRDSVLVECELNSRDGANGSAASTSKQAGDTCVAITPITTAGARVPFSALCDLPQRVKSERKRKKPPLTVSHVQSTGSTSHHRRRQKRRLRCLVETRRIKVN